MLKDLTIKSSSYLLENHHFLTHEKKMKSNRNNCDLQNFVLPESFLLKSCDRSLLFSYLKKVLEASSGMDQIKFLKNFQENILHEDSSPDELELICKIICELLFQASVKSPHKKALSKIIIALSEKNCSIAENCLEQALVRTICSTKDFKLTLINILYLIDDLAIGKKVIKQSSSLVWEYALTIFGTRVKELKATHDFRRKNDEYSLCQNILKLVIYCLKHCHSIQKTVKLRDGVNYPESEELRILLDFLLLDSDTTLDCRLNAAFAFCYHQYFYSGTLGIKELVFSDQSLYPPSSCLCLISGVMTVLSIEEFVNLYELGRNIVLQCFSISKSINDAELYLLCSRNMLQWSSFILSEFSKDCMVHFAPNTLPASLFVTDEEFLKLLFEYVLQNMDHFIDTLRHQSKEIFRNVLSLHLFFSDVEPNESKWINGITHALLEELSVSSRAKYGLLSCIVEVVGTGKILELHPSLPDELYQSLNEPHLVSCVVDLCQVLFRVSVNDEKHFYDAWMKPLLNILCNGTSLQVSAINQHLFPKLLSKLETLPLLISDLSLLWEKNLGYSFGPLVTCIKLIQKKNGSSDYSTLLDIESMEKALTHADDQVRLSGFSLICESFKPTEGINTVSFKLLEHSLPFNINCQSPSFRQQLISYMKKLFNRMIESSRKMKFKTKEGELKLPDYYQDFLLWLKSFLFNCLYPGANFPRRVTALNLIFLIGEMFHRCQYANSDAEFWTLLFVLQDSYDKNKSIALKMLSNTPLPCNLVAANMFQAAYSMASSRKPSEVCTSAYLFSFFSKQPSFLPVVMHFLASEDYTLDFPMASNNKDSGYFIVLLLMFQLRNQLKLSKRNLLKASSESSMYGVLNCIRIVLSDLNIYSNCSQWKDLVKELLELSLCASQLVEPVVCHSSPEGYLPADEILELPFLDAKTRSAAAQSLLLCCWRTHKEVSLLFGMLSENLKHPEQCILDASQAQKIGKYFLKQLSLVKHNGAFEQAYIGFNKLCQNLWRCFIGELHRLPKLWLEDLIISIQNPSESIHLSLTRRGAGLPFIVQGILTSGSDSSFFKDSLSTFLELSRCSKPDVQIHALNILRALMKNSLLSECVMPFISESYKLSINKLKSNSWGVRNSATLLFSALMDRVFGDETKKTRMTGKAFFTHFGDLHCFLLDELRDCVEAFDQKNCKPISIQCNLYAVLSVLSRLYPAPGGKDSLLLLFIPYLWKCLSCSVWKIRLLVSEVLLSYSNQKSILPTIDKTIGILSSNKLIQNEIHGYLSLVLSLLNELNLSLQKEKDKIKILFLEWFDRSFDFFVRCNRCLTTKVIYLEIYLRCMLLYDVKTVSVINCLLEDIFSVSVSEPSLDCDNYFVMAVSIVFFYLISQDISDFCKHQAKRMMVIEELIQYFLMSPHKAVRCTAFEILLWISKSNEQAYPDCLNPSDDVHLQKLFNILCLLDRRKFHHLSLSNDIILIMIDCVTKERDLLIVGQIYKILYFYPNSACFLKWSFIPDCPAPMHDLKKLKFLSDSMNCCPRDETKCPMLLYSVHLFIHLHQDFQKLKNEFCDAQKFQGFYLWLSKIKEFSSPDASLLCRKTAIAALCMLFTAGVLPISKGISCVDSVLWESILILLVDDEPEVKSMISELVLTIKFGENQEPRAAVVPLKGLSLMLEIYTETHSENPIECINSLINWMLPSQYASSCDKHHMFDELPFDKGELNVFREDLDMTLFISKHLSKFLNSHRHSLDKDPYFKVNGFFECDGCLTIDEIILHSLKKIEYYLKECARTAFPLCDTSQSEVIIKICQLVAVVSLLCSHSKKKCNLVSFKERLLAEIKNINLELYILHDLISMMDDTFFTKSMENINPCYLEDQ